jgi:hypothetical protein
VTDSGTGEPLERLEGVVREGVYVDTLRPAGDGWVAAAGERPGTYTVEIRAHGYTPWDTVGIVAPDNGCHVGEVRLHVRVNRIRAGAADPRARKS